MKIIIFLILLTLAGTALIVMAVTGKPRMVWGKRGANYFTRGSRLSSAPSGHSHFAWSSSCWVTMAASESRHCFSHASKQRPQPDDFDLPVLFNAVAGMGGLRPVAQLCAVSSNGKSA